MVVLPADCLSDFSFGEVGAHVGAPLGKDVVADHDVVVLNGPVVGQVDDPGGDLSVEERIDGKTQGDGDHGLSLCLVLALGGGQVAPVPTAGPADVVVEEGIQKGLVVVGAFHRPLRQSTAAGKGRRRRIHRRGSESGKVEVYRGFGRRAEWSGWVRFSPVRVN